MLLTGHYPQTPGMLGLKRGIIMATNFKISIHRNSENLHLKLTGDFDGISAHELLDILKRYSNRTSRVFIHTSCLANIHPFGLNVFHNHLDVLKKKSLELVFTGDNASELAPEKPMLFDLIISTVPPVASSGTTPSALSSMRTE
jgi:anti-anti-sigma regulatory factor